MEIVSGFIGSFRLMGDRNRWLHIDFGVDLVPYRLCETVVSGNE